MNEKPDPVSPNLSLLVKLGSVVAHVEELLSPDGHEYDKTAIRTLLEDSEVREWMATMTKMAFIPVSRKAKR